MTYLRFFLVILWAIVSCFVTLLLAVFFWKKPVLNKVFSRVFAWGALPLAKLKVEVEGVEHFDAPWPAVYVGNHQSGFDLAVCGSFANPNMVIIGKKELALIPFYGWMFYAAGNVFVDRANKKKAIGNIQSAVDAVRERKVCVAMFPEGTRNKDGDGLLPFKKGAFHLAIETGVPIVPVVVGPIRHLAHWKTRTLKGGTVRVKILPPISSEGLRREDVTAFRDRIHALMEETYRGLQKEAGL